MSVRDWFRRRKKKDVRVGFTKNRAGGTSGKELFEHLLRDVRKVAKNNLTMDIVGERSGEDGELFWSGDLSEILPVVEKHLKRGRKKRLERGEAEYGKYAYAERDCLEEAYEELLDWVNWIEQQAVTMALSLVSFRLRQEAYRARASKAQGN